ncbi:class I SAM-dependent methyltransferase [Nocardioides caeni]|uniref:Class I SAM-dependent methyltransferase n=1 Tax=Nocardioides caeni TaxID=574700 RepID=A0A4S8N2K2_9ACTN|nr:class I SAM-dependent methyltransferase [Nocardioides caeni]THV09209.1 class I SAM-dependent methyltransferase [Nocardioides caeni]
MNSPPAPPADSLVTVDTCLACRSRDVRTHAPSGRTGFVILQCRDCGLRFLRDRLSLDAVVSDYDMDADAYAAFTDITRPEVIDSSHAEVLERIDQLVGPKPGRSLFDVGAGDGGFLAMARERGFAPAGNELSSGAIEMAWERNKVELHKGDLATLDAGLHDAVTLWCVLAHVPDGDVLLEDVKKVLKPGGLMFLQTPRWSKMDGMGMVAHDATKGRASRITDRRMAMHHMSLHTVKSMRATLERLGWEVVSIEPHVRYSLTTASYLHSLGISEKAAERASRPVNALLDRDLFFRNVLDVYARIPG